MEKLFQVKTPAGPLSGPAAPDLDSVLSGRRLRGIALILGVIVIYGVASAHHSLTEPRAVIAWLAAVVFASTFVISTYRPFPIAVLLCGLSGSAMQLALPDGAGFIIAIVAVTQATKLGEIPGCIVAGVAGVGYLVAFAIAAHHVSTGVLVAPAAGLGFAYIAAAGFHRLRQERRKLWEEKQKTEALLQEVVAGRDAQIRAAALDERAYLAREIHDILAHTLSALSVQLEGARMLLEQRPDDPATMAAVERAGSLAREGLDETRRAVGTLRGDSLPGPEALPRLAADFEQDSRVPCRLTIEGRPVMLPPEARLALYRTAQESLTNIRKHAEASTIDIRLRYMDEGVELTIENEGSARPGSRSGGHGLNGLRERAELVHGSLDAVPTAIGFKVRLWLPA